MQYAICIVKRSSIAWWTGKSWSGSLGEAKLFDNCSQRQRKIQHIYQHIDGIASVVSVNPERSGEASKKQDSAILDTFGVRVACRMAYRVKNLLLRKGLDSDDKIRQTPDYKLWEIRGLGEQSFYEIRAKLPYTG